MHVPLSQIITSATNSTTINHNKYNYSLSRSSRDPYVTNKMEEGEKHRLLLIIYSKSDNR